jgi:myo-inositol-1(or 4)-monophosphatase
VINMPVLGELYYAQRGGGAFLNGKPIRVSGRRELKKMLLVHDSDFALNKEKMLSSMGRFSDSVFGIRVLGAATANFVQVINGTADIYVEYAIKPWDIAAGCLLVEEAGGKVTDFSGKRWTPWSKNLVVSNGRAHDAVLTIIRG